MPCCHDNHNTVIELAMQRRAAFSWAGQKAMRSLRSRSLRSRDALHLSSIYYNDVIIICQEVEGQQTGTLCMAVRTYVRVVSHGDGECGRDEGRRASGGGEYGRGERKGRRRMDRVQRPQNMEER